MQVQILTWYTLPPCIFDASLHVDWILILERQNVQLYGTIDARGYRSLFLGQPRAALPAGDLGA
jgi:hypothetical protein